MTARAVFEKTTDPAKAKFKPKDLVKVRFLQEPKSWYEVTLIWNKKGKLCAPCPKFVENSGLCNIAGPWILEIEMLRSYVPPKQLVGSLENK